MDITVGGVLYNLQAGEVESKLMQFAGVTLLTLKNYFFWSCLTYILGPLVIMRYKKHAREIEESKHLRGETGPIAPEKLKKLFEEDKLQGDIPLGGIYLPRNFEPRHVFVVGAPGSGKTVCISQALKRIMERGEKALVYDVQGDYLKWFWRSRDVIFNPLDRRCCSWNIFNEIAYLPDVFEYSKSLIPDVPGLKDPYFTRAAAQVFAGILQTCISAGQTTNSALWQMLEMTRLELLDNLQGPGTSDAIQHLSQEKTGDNVLSTLKTYSRAFGYMADRGGEAFSIKNWVEDDRDRRCVFLTSNQEYEETLKPLLSLFIDIASAKLNSMDTQLDRRFFVVLDEFATLQRLNSVKKLLTGSRKKGGSVWLGVQTIGQIEAIYQNHDSDAIIGSCASAIVLAVHDNHSAEYLAKKLGEREIRETNETISMGPELVRAGSSLQQRETLKKAVLASEISGLKERQAFLKFSGYPISRTEFEVRPFTAVTEALLLREDLRINTHKQPDPAHEPDITPALPDEGFQF